MFQATSGLPIMEVGQETLHRDNARRSGEDLHPLSIKSHIRKHPTSAPQRKPRIGIVTGRFCRDNLTSHGCL